MIFNFYFHVAAYTFVWADLSMSTLTQNCLPENTFVSTPNSLCPYFQIFDQIFVVVVVVVADAPPTNQNQKKVKIQFSYHSPCMNSVWTQIFNSTECVNSHFQLYRCTTKLAHYDTRTPLFYLHLLKLFWIKNRKALNAKLMFIGIKNLLDQSGPVEYFRHRNGLKYAYVNQW